MEVECRIVRHEGRLSRFLTQRLSQYTLVKGNVASAVDAMCGACMYVGLGVIVRPRKRSAWHSYLDAIRLRSYPNQWHDKQ